MVGPSYFRWKTIIILRIDLSSQIFDLPHYFQNLKNSLFAISFQQKTLIKLSRAIAREWKIHGKKNWKIELASQPSVILPNFFLQNVLETICDVWAKKLFPATIFSILSTALSWLSSAIFKRFVVNKAFKIRGIISRTTVKYCELLT